MDYGDIERALQLMEKYDCTRLTLGELVLERTPKVEVKEVKVKDLSDEERQVLLENDLFAASGIVPKPFEREKP